MCIPILSKCDLPDDGLTEDEDRAYVGILFFVATQGRNPTVEQVSQMMDHCGTAIATDLIMAIQQKKQEFDGAKNDVSNATVTIH